MGKPDELILLNEHLEKTKNNLKKDGINPSTTIGKQIIRLTKETIRQYHEIKDLKKKIAGLEGQVPDQQVKSEAVKFAKKYLNHLNNLIDEVDEAAPLNSHIYHILNDGIRMLHHLKKMEVF